MRSLAGKMVGVILAAGKGTRMQPFASLLPKPILPVCNRPLLEYQLEMMKACGLTEVFIVIEHRGLAIVSALGDGHRQGIAIHYVEQTDTLGLAHALGRLEEHIHSPFLLFLGDIYFVTESLRPLMEEVLSGQANANLVSKIETDPEMVKRNFVIIEDGDGRVRRVIEKPRYTQSRLKGCGLYVFDQHVFDAVRRTPRTAMRDEYEITDTIQILIDDGLVVRHQPIVKHDSNLTKPEDLLGINLMELARRGQSKLVGQGVELARGTTVHNSVIGDGVKVQHPIRIADSMIFPGVVVTAESDLDHVIVEQSNIVYCHGGSAGWSQVSPTRS